MFFTFFLLRISFSHCPKCSKCQKTKVCRKTQHAFEMNNCKCVVFLFIFGWDVRIRDTRKRENSSSQNRRYPRIQIRIGYTPIPIQIFVKLVRDTPYPNSDLFSNRYGDTPYPHSNWLVKSIWWYFLSLIRFSGDIKVWRLQWEKIALIMSKRKKSEDVSDKELLNFIKEETKQRQHKEGVSIVTQLTTKL